MSEELKGTLEDMFAVAEDDVEEQSADVDRLDGSRLGTAEHS